MTGVVVLPDQTGTEGFGNDLSWTGAPSGRQACFSEGKTKMTETLVPSLRDHCPEWAVTRPKRIAAVTMEVIICRRSKFPNEVDGSLRKSPIWQANGSNGKRS